MKTQWTKEQIVAAIRSDRKPVVCLINGDYVNMGLGLLKQCDTGTYAVEESQNEIVVHWRAPKLRVTA